MQYIYVLTDPDTYEIRYIGKTHDPSTRLKQHYSSLNKKTYKNHWVKSLKAKGKKPFMVVICEVEEKWIDELEKLFIHTMRQNPENKLTNICDGGEGACGRRHSELTKKKMSISRKGLLKGRTHVISEETRRKMSEAKKGKHKSELHKRKISETLKGMPLYNRGKPRTKESLRKMIESRRRNKELKEINTLNQLNEVRNDEKE